MIQALSASWGAGSEQYTKMPDQSLSPTGGDMDLSPGGIGRGPMLEEPHAGLPRVKWEPGVDMR
jgi:hypothetical protein